MGPKTRELIAVLEELAAVLKRDGNIPWSSLIHRAKSRLENDDYSGIGSLLSAYGGMGSINDLVLGQSVEAGEFSWKAGHFDLNEKFLALKNRAWEIAYEIKRAQE